MFIVGTCESAVCIRIEYRIESGVTIRIRIESRIESAKIICPSLVQTGDYRPSRCFVIVAGNDDYNLVAVSGDYSIVAILVAEIGDYFRRP